MQIAVKMDLIQIALIVCIATLFALISHPQVADAVRRSDGIRRASDANKVAEGENNSDNKEAKGDRTIIDHQNDFAIRLFKDVSCCAEGNDCNLLLSPLSINLALGMICLGARGATVKEVGDAYRLARVGVSRVIDTAKVVVKSIQRSALRNKIDMNIANAIFVSRAFSRTMLPTYQRELSESFNASSQLVDFGSKAGIHQINGWANSATRGLIERVLDEPEKDAVIMIASLVYFFSEWQHQFDPHSTQFRNFYNRGNDQLAVKMPFMHGHRHYRYARNQQLDATLIELPYKGERAANVSEK